MTARLRSAHKVVTFPGPQPVSPFHLQINPVDLAADDITWAAHDLAVAVGQAYTVDQALELRRRIEGLMVLLKDVETLAIVRAQALCH